MEEINAQGGVLGRPLELDIEDNQSDAKVAVSATQKLFDVDGVDFLLTPWAEQTLPVLPIITQRKKIAITVSAGTPGITADSPYLFRTYPSDGLSISALIDYKGNNRR